MIRKFLFIFLSFTPHLYSDSVSFTLENDFFGSREDNHYTNGASLVWMQDANKSDMFDFIFEDDQTNIAVSLSHQIFTPTNKWANEPIWDDLPYAGYMKLNFLLYKSSKNYFHEFGVNIGAVGPITDAEEIQSFFHEVVGDGVFQGWDNQLDDQFMAGISYQFAYKTDPIEIDNYKLDWISNVRGDIGNFYSGVLVSSTVRVGSFVQKSFISTGTFMVTDESDLLNATPSTGFNWDLSFGLFADAVYNYYIADEGIKQGYKIAEMEGAIGWQTSFNLFYDKFKYTYKLKSTYVNDQRSKQWGGMTFSWIF